MTGVFYDNEQHDLPRSHNRPLYVTSNVNGVELKRAMLDLRSSINNISLSELDAVGISRDKIKQPIEVSSLRGHKTFTVGFVCLNLMVGPIRAAHKLQVIDSRTSYHLLLGRPRIHRKKAVLQSPVSEGCVEREKTPHQCHGISIPERGSSLLLNGLF